MINGDDSIALSKRPSRIGIIACTEGGVFQGLFRILQITRPDEYQFVVVTDRSCGIEKFCIENEILRQRFDEPSDNAAFSRQSAQYFERFGVQFVLLYFLRLVTADLFSVMPTFNTHPALLPAFAGLNALKRARLSGVRFFGATLHVVDDTVDGGSIVAQCCQPIPPNADLRLINKLSYLQKLYLSLVLTDLFEREAIRVDLSTGKLELSGDLPFSAQYNPALLSADKAHHYELHCREELAGLLI